MNNMDIKEIKAWETSDGELFKFEDKAIEHEKNLKVEHLKKIKWFQLRIELEKELGVSVYRDSQGWDCKRSPIGECVYEVDAVEKYGDDCCYYCGHPEERK